MAPQATDGTSLQVLTVHELESENRKGILASQRRVLCVELRTQSDAERLLQYLQARGTGSPESCDFASSLANCIHTIAVIWQGSYAKEEPFSSIWTNKLDSIRNAVTKVTQSPPVLQWEVRDTGLPAVVPWSRYHSAHISTLVCTNSRIQSVQSLLVAMRSLRAVTSLICSGVTFEDGTIPSNDTAGNEDATADAVLPKAVGIESKHQKPVERSIISLTDLERDDSAIDKLPLLLSLWNVYLGRSVYVENDRWRTFREILASFVWDRLVDTSLELYASPTGITFKADRVRLTLNELEACFHCEVAGKSLKCTWEVVVASITSSARFLPLKLTFDREDKYGAVKEAINNILDQVGISEKYQTSSSEDYNRATKDTPKKFEFEIQKICASVTILDDPLYYS